MRAVGGVEHFHILSAYSYQVTKKGLVRKQHIVSKFYLKGFTDSSNQLRRLVLPGDHSHLISADKATVITDFYTLTLEDGQVSDYFERAFAKIEEPASRILKSVTEGRSWPLSQDDKDEFAVWIALQYLRSEGIRTQVTNMDSLIIRLMVGTSGKAALRQHIEKAEGQVISEDRLAFEWEELTKEGGPTLMPDPETHLRMLTDFLEPTAAMFASKQWSLNEFQSESLVTGDHPVSLVAAPDHPRYMGVGLATAAGYSLPLSRKVGLFIGASPELPDLRGPGNALLAKATNQQTILNSRKCLYYHPDDESTVRELHLPEPKTREVDSPGNGFVKEEGFFGHLSDDELEDLPAPLRADDDESFSLDDLHWPIPRRVVTWAGQPPLANTTQNMPLDSQ